MAQIGTFTRDQNGAYAGTIRTLTLNVKATIKPCARDNDKAPRLSRHRQWCRVRRRLE